jgi:hypothetical protein
VVSVNPVSETVVKVTRRRNKLGSSSSSDELQTDPALAAAYAQLKVETATNSAAKAKNQTVFCAPKKLYVM